MTVIPVSIAGTPESVEPSRVRDFPLYREITPRGWLIVIAFSAAGFALLMLPTITGIQAPAMRWLGVLLFVCLPLIGLRLVAGAAWSRLLAPPSLRDILVGLAFVPVVWILSFSTAYVVRELTETAANPVDGLMAAMSTGELAGFLASTLPQLFGEELVTIIPFLAILSILHVHRGMSRRASLIIALIVSALIFGAIHLPTYDWHVIQALVIIGVARIALTLAYLVTKNVWSSTVTHVANDWSLFAIPFVFAS